MMMGALAMTLVVLVYAANFVAVRYSVQHGLAALDLAALRFGLAGLLMAPAFFRLGPRDLGGIGWTRAVALSCFAGAPYMLLFYFGLSHAPASHGAVLNPGLTPTIVFLALVSLGKQSFSLARAASLALIVAGLILVTRSSFSIDRDMLFGDALLLVSGVCWGLFTVSVRIWNVQPRQAAIVVSVISLAIYLPLYFVFWFHGVPDASLGHIVSQAALQGLVLSIAALYLVTFAVGKLGAQMSALFTPLIPVMTTLMAIPLLGEMPTSLQVAGIATVVLGMLCVAMAT